MKRLRTYITRLLVVLLLFSGFSLYVVQPAQGRQSPDAFTDWLSKMAKPAGAMDLQQELENLRQSTEHLDKVIEKASRLVSENDNGFSFSFAESTASQQLYQLLLIEWNQFQTGNAMSSVPVQQSAKSFAPVKMYESPLACSPGLPTVDTNIRRGDVESTLNPASPASYFLIPMVGGIAIGAP